MSEAEHAGVRVRYWRTQKQMAQKDLAARAQIDHTRLCRIEKGKLPAHAYELERIATELGMTMAEFYGEIPATTGETTTEAATS